MVQVGPNLLAINHLRPYPSWESFRELIRRVFREYVAVAGDRPISRMGLRYINRIDIPEGKFDIGSYLTLNPALCASLDRTLAAFYQRYELIEDTPPGILIHQTGSQLKEETWLMLDLDFVSESVGGPHDEESLVQWLDQAHARILESFRDSLNATYFDSLR